VVIAAVGEQTLGLEDTRVKAWFCFSSVLYNKPQLALYSLA